MKKIDLLHTTVLIIAILCGYSALRAFLAILNVSIYYSDLFYSMSRSPILPTFIQAVVYLIACILLVRNSKRIATYLLGNDRPDFEEFLAADDDATTDPAPPATAITDPDAIEWHLDRRNIIFVFFIGIGLYTMIQNIPMALDALYTYFKNEVDARHLTNSPVRRDDLIYDLLSITIGALLIYAAPTLTNFIERTIAPRLDSGSKTT
jgi:hypothetical protein